MTFINDIPPAFIAAQVKLALLEDIGQQDLTADLIPEAAKASANLISRQSAILCGQSWFNEVFSQLDDHIEIDWYFHDGEVIAENQVICSLKGSARKLLTGERTAMNFLQTLSGTATTTHRYAQRIADLRVQLLDTRKTLPGLRSAQKYAVRCGGGVNHRFGLFDEILIKENHIVAAGSIAAAVAQAKHYHPGVSIEVEVETLAEFSEAIEADTDIVLLDNFSLDQLTKAVELNGGQSLLEASGGITLDNLRAIAETGVDRISIGALTKDIQAVDLSLRFIHA